jgi:nucleotide-binding universal stress UspA family protein
LVADAETRLHDALAPEDTRHRYLRKTVEVGEPHAQILAHAAAEHVDLIVMGTHGRAGVAHMVLGSVAERVVRTAPCPVLTVRRAVSPIAVSARVADRPGELSSHTPS